MYRFCLLITLFFVSTALQAQLFTVSDDVKKAFDLQYPEAKEVDWNGGIDQHTVSFRLGTKKYKASYTKSGSWNWTETKVPLDAVPARIREGFQASKYKDWTVKDCIEIIKPLAEANEYKIIVQKSALNKKALMFDAKGRLYEELISF